MAEAFAKATMESLRGQLPRWEIKAGETFAILPQTFYDVVAGRAVLLRGGRYQRVVGPGDVIHLPEGNSPWRLQPISGEVHLSVGTPDEFDRASQRPDGTRLFDPEHFQADQLRGWREDEWARLRAEQRRLSDGMTDLIDEDGCLHPGPYLAVDARLVIAVVEDPMIQTLVPRKLRSRLTNDRFLVVFANYPRCIGQMGDEQVSLAYRETTLFVPVLDPLQGGPGLYCPELYPDNMMAIVVGRELYGWPKLHADTYIDHEHADGEHAVCVLNGEVAAGLHVPSWTRPERNDWVAQLTHSVLGEDLDAQLVRRLMGTLVADAASVDEWVETVGEIPAILPRNLTTSEHRIEQLISAPFKIGRVYDELFVARDCPFTMNLGRLNVQGRVDAFSVRLDMAILDSKIALDRAEGVTRGTLRRGRILGELLLTHVPLLRKLRSRVGELVPWGHE